MREDRLPKWLKVKGPGSPGYIELKSLVKKLNLNTVCESALCPNIGECWGSGTATFMILGDICTRSCGFCAIATGRPQNLDLQEPERVAKAVEALGLRHAVITSVNRDELEDGGANIFAETIRRIRLYCSQTSVEVLIPDFEGDGAALCTVMEAKPDILNHNIETVPRLYYRVRPQAKYHRSIELIRKAKQFGGAITKSGMMLGVGEEKDEVYGCMRDLVDAECDILTLGQYLRPSPRHIPIVRFYHPEEFEEFKRAGHQMGFSHVESGPLVRSSYHAADQVVPPLQMDRPLQNEALV